MPTANDTIAAIATPPGRGGIGIIRLSGPRSAALLGELFLSSHKGFSSFTPRRLHHGHILDARGRVLDEALVTLMPGPHSFTGEDVAEIHCHGGPAVLAAVLEATLDLGARPAGRGEFAKRAFLNGRLDLTQAEAVAEMIAAPSAAGVRLAEARLSGRFGRTVRELRAGLEDLRAKLCLAVDFPEEEIECLSREDFLAGAVEVRERITSLLASHARTRVWREGALAVLAGRVNAGKSSLLNALLGRTRAIVTEFPGTTRDFIEEALDLDGLPVRLTDTAGLRDNGAILADPAEAEGLRISRDLAGQADLLLLVIDLAAPAGEPEAELAASAGPDRVLVVGNKADLIPADAQPQALARFREQGFETLIVSARTGQGLEDLPGRIRARIAARAGGGLLEPEDGELTPNLRQSRILKDALEELAGLARDIEAGVPYDLLGVRLETVCVRLAEITGEIAGEDVLKAVFESFCIGK